MQELLISDGEARKGKQAVAEGWPISPEVRQLIIDRQVATLRDPTSKKRDVNAAVRNLVAAFGQNVMLELRTQGIDLTVNGDVNIQCSLETIRDIKGIADIARSVYARRDESLGRNKPGQLGDGRLGGALAIGPSSDLNGSGNRRHGDEEAQGADSSD